MIHVLEEGIRKLITVINVRKMNGHVDILRYILNLSNWPTYCTNAFFI